MYVELPRLYITILTVRKVYVGFRNEIFTKFCMIKVFNFLMVSRGFNLFTIFYHILIIVETRNRMVLLKKRKPNALQKCSRCVKYFSDSERRLDISTRWLFLSLCKDCKRFPKRAFPNRWFGGGGGQERVTTSIPGRPVCIFIFEIMTSKMNPSYQS